MIEFQFLTPHPTSLSEQLLLAECVWTFTKRGGPGGQHRNKTQSAAVLTHQPTGITAEANERRDQHQNRRVAMERLRFMLAWFVRDKDRSSVSDLWMNRSKGGRINVSSTHWDLPELIAEALDRLYQTEFSVSEAAALLGVSSGQLTKFFRNDPQSMNFLNRVRTEKGLGRLR